jgi:hypothetical protein
MESVSPCTQERTVGQPIQCLETRDGEKKFQLKKKQSVNGIKGDEKSKEQARWVLIT